MLGRLDAVLDDAYRGREEIGQMTNAVHEELVAVGAPFWLVVLIMVCVVTILMVIGYFAITFYRRKKPN